MEVRMKRIGLAMWSAIINLIQFIVRRIRYKGRIEDKLDAVLSRQNDSERRLLRLEIMEAMRRDDRAVVHQLYDEYKAMGGDSWMDDLFLLWKSKQKENRCQ